MSTGFYECTRCGCTNMRSEDCTIQTFYGNLEEPPEWEFRCPSCGAGDDAIEEIENLCYGCKREKAQVGFDFCESCEDGMKEANAMLTDELDYRRD